MVARKTRAASRIVVRARAAAATLESRLSARCVSCARDPASSSSLLCSCLGCGCGAVDAGAADDRAAAAAADAGHRRHVSRCAASLFRCSRPQSPQREPLRTRLVQHLLAQDARPRSRSGDYDAVVEHLATVTRALHAGGDRRGQAAAGLEPDRALPGRPRVAARRRGARAVGPARCCASCSRTTRRRPSSTSACASGASTRARRSSSPLERFEEGIVEVWEEHARLTPTPEVLTTLARLYVERRNALVALFQANERRVPLAPRCSRACSARR